MPAEVSLTEQPSSPFTLVSRLVCDILLTQEVVQQLKKEEIPTKFNHSTFEIYFNELHGLETEVALAWRLFKQKKSALAAAINEVQEARKKALETELKSLALALFYMGGLLEEYYHTYGNEELSQKHQLMQSEAQSYLQGKVYQNNALAEQFIEQLAKDAKNKAISTINALKTGTINGDVSALNMERIYWIFCHLLVNKSIKLASNIGIANHHSAGAVIKKLSLADPALNYASVVFYGLRLLIDVTMLLKHTFSSEEAGISRSERCAREWEERKISIVNNLVWGVTNFVTNFTFSGMPVSSQITAAVFIIDVLLAVWTKSEEKKKYLQAKTMLEANIHNMNNMNNMNKKNYLKLKKTALALALALALEEEKLANLNQDWRNKKAVLNVNINAAWLLMGSFITITATDLANLAKMIPSVSQAVLTPVWSALGLSIAIVAMGKLIYSTTDSHFLAISIPILLTGGMAALYIICPPVAMLFNMAIGIAAMALYLSGSEVAAVNAAKDAYYLKIAELLELQWENDEAKTAELLKLKGKNDKEKIAIIAKEYSSMDAVAQLQADENAMKELNILRGKMRSCQYQLIKALVERIVAPLIIFLAFAVAWEIGVVALTLYIACKGIQAATNHKKNYQNAKNQNVPEDALTDTRVEKRNTIIHRQCFFTGSSNDW